MSEVAPLISDLAIILVVAGVVTVIFKWLNQPVILGYIVAGVIAGPAFSFFPTVADSGNIKIWADIGVIFLLFAMGLDFSFKKLMNVGVTAVVGAFTIVCGMMFLGYTAGNAMGFSHMSSIFLGGMLSMSSTAIVFKAFNDLGLMQQKFAGIVLGILVVEDLLAVVMMVVLSTLAVSKHFEGGAMLESIAKLAAFLIFWFALGIFLVPSLLKKINRFFSGEILLITSLGLCLGMVMIATKAGFSSALGAFVMGSLLAETMVSEKITQVVQPVKDLFGSIFFVSVGMMIEPSMIVEYIVPILILTLLVLVGQVFFASFGVLLSGQSLGTAMRAGFSLTQVGEFSFIIASLGVSLKVTDSYLYPVIVAVSVITTFLTPYMIRLAPSAHAFVEKHLPLPLKQFMTRYAAGNMTVRQKSDWHHLLRSMILSVAFYVVICLFFISMYFSYLHPLLMEELPDLRGKFLSFLILMFVISPLLWGIIMKKNHSPEYRKLWVDNKFNRGPLVSLILLRIFLCIIIVMGIVTYIFNVASGAGFVVALVIISGIYFSTWMRKQSIKIEKQFIDNLRGSGEEKEGKSQMEASFQESDIPFKELHLADFVIDPQSPYVGKTLIETAIRQLFEVSVISVMRGNDRIDIPSGKEHLYPYDKITVVGTDEQLGKFQESIELRVDKKGKDDVAEVSSPEMKIEEISLDKGSPLINVSIRQAALQDCIVLGIQREDYNIANPKSDTVLLENDTLWVVGRSDTIKRLAQVELP